MASKSSLPTQTGLWKLPDYTTEHTEQLSTPLMAGSEEAPRTTSKGVPKIPWSHDSPALQAALQEGKKRKQGGDCPAAAELPGAACPPQHPQAVPLAPAPHCLLLPLASSAIINRLTDFHLSASCLTCYLQIPHTCCLQSAWDKRCDKPTWGCQGDQKSFPVLW